MGTWQGVVPAPHQNPALPTMPCSPSVGSCTTSSTVTVCLVCQVSWGEPVVREGPMPGETEAGRFGDTPSQALREAVTPGLGTVLEAQGGTAVPGAREAQLTMSRRRHCRWGPPTTPSR